MPGDSAATQIELAVDMTCEQCSAVIERHLKSNKNIKSFNINLEKQTVFLESALPSSEVVKFVEETGKKALITGVGAGGRDAVNLGSAVAIMNEGLPETRIKGVVRLVQSTMKVCIVDGTLDGLCPTSKHRLAIHEYGDITDGCKSCGQVLDLEKKCSRQNLYGDLGEIACDDTGHSTFRIETERVKVWDIIGRSMVVSSQHNEKLSLNWNKLACGIIARSAGILENFKRICACDGTTIWEEQTFSDVKK
ncbi:copper chaperone for superoxide dismutase-like [Watersipora subatra]|uniref:copper chaperone for superoxide dismutase-like n=1 Tax=Watersipora subatra TaxID=2589382 RepID=UPI00355C2549